MNFEKIIKQLEQESAVLEPTLTQRNFWNEKIQHHSDTFLSNLKGDRKTYIGDHPTTNLPITDNPKPIEELLTFLEDNIQGTGKTTASGGHLGFIPGGGMYTAALGDFMAAVLNKFTGTYFASPGAVRMENQLLFWLCQMIGYPAETGMGNFTSGGSIANLMAVTLARDTKGIRAKDVEKSTLYLTKHAHHSNLKALRIIGMSEAIIRYVPLDNFFKMNVPALREMIQSDLKEGLKPFLVIATAGTTEPGAIDPLDDIANVAQEFNLWYHVDAAYGGFFLLVDDLKSKFKGIERSDSVVVDPHKGLFLPYGTGALLVRNVQLLFQSYHYAYNYRYPYKMDVLSPADLSPELSRNFRGLSIWLSLHLLGLKPFKSALEEKIWLCRYFYEKISSRRGFQVGPYPELSIATYRYVPENGDANRFNEKLLEFVNNNDGRVFISSMNIDGVYWLRIAVLHFRTHLLDIDLLLEILDKGVLQISKQLAAL